MMSRGSFFGQNNESPLITDRVQWAASTMGNFAKITGVGEDLQADPETVLADLLADLMHWCDAQKTNRHLGGTVDFQSALKRARDHYKHEFAKEG
jgi:hypothetical protein